MPLMHGHPDLSESWLVHGLIHRFRFRRQFLVAMTAFLRRGRPGIGADLFAGGEGQKVNIVTVAPNHRAGGAWLRQAALVRDQNVADGDGSRRPNSSFPIRREHV